MKRRPIAALLFALLVALVLFPLRLAMDMTGLASSDGGISARQVRGSIWSGQIYGLMLGNVHVGNVHVGDVRVGVAPLDLLMARLRMNIVRENDVAGPLSGAWINGFGQSGMENMTGTLAADGVLGIVPVSTLEMSGLTTIFSGNLCSRAEGQLRLRLNSSFAGLNLSQGVSGTAICDGEAVQFPLVSQTGLETMTLRVRRDGHYTAQLVVREGRDVDSAALLAAGLTQRGEEYVLSLEGQM